MASQLQMWEFQKNFDDHYNFSQLKISQFISISELFIAKIKAPIKRVSMGLTDRRKTAKNLVDSRKNWKILTVSRK